MNWLDIVLIVILAVASIYGIVKGLVRQAFGFLSVILGLVFALSFYSQMAWLYQRFISSEVLTQFIGFLTVFLVVMCVGWACSNLISKMIKGPLKLLDKILGGCLGFLVGILICSVVIYALMVFPVSKKTLKGSQVSPVCMKMTKIMYGFFPKDLKKKFKEAYQDLTKKVEKNVKGI